MRSEKRNRGRLMLAAIGCAVVFALTQMPGQAQQERLVCEASEMVGDWHGQKITDPPWSLLLKWAFKFNQDGTYSYCAGQGSFEWTSHRGKFTVKRATGAPSQRFPCVITLTPSQDTVKNNPENKLGLAPLLSINLKVGDKERTYRTKA